MRLARRNTTGTYNVTPVKKQTELTVKCLLEAPVTLITAQTTLNRYFFLFSDVLLTVKQKSEISYKLKDKIKVSDLWIKASGYHEIYPETDVERSFIIGWPTYNYVATFESKKIRDDWFHHLSKIIVERRRVDIVWVEVLYKTIKADQSCTIRVSSEQTAQYALDMALSQWGIPIGEAVRHRLWTQTTTNQDCNMQPLMGHENIAAIKSADNSARFIVRLKNQASGPSTRRRLFGQLRRKRQARSVDSSTSRAALFGVPLTALYEDNHIAQPVLDMLHHLYKNGPQTDGVFRKPPKQSIVKELREELDQGRPVDFSPHSALVTASLLKEFLRNIPHRLLVNELLAQWLLAAQMIDGNEKLAKFKKLVAHLPPVNYQLLRHILCVLAHIAANAAHNQMSAQNVAVCVAHSTLDTPHDTTLHHASDSVTNIPCVLQYLIENVASIFGSETLNLFDDVRSTCMLSPQSRADTVSVISTDGESILSTSIGSGHDLVLAPVRQSKRLVHHQSRDSGLSDHFAPTIERTVSGEHLLLIDDQNDEMDSRSVSTIKKSSTSSASAPPPVPLTDPPPLDDDDDNAIVIVNNSSNNNRRCSPTSVTSSSGHGSAASVASSTSPRLARRQPLTSADADRQRRRFILRSKSADPDSSTVTESSSIDGEDEVDDDDDDPTPVVSRESSRAQDCKNIQTRLYLKEQQRQHASRITNENNKNNNNNNVIVTRPLYSWEASSDQKISRPVAQVPAQQRHTAIAGIEAARLKINGALARQANRQLQGQTTLPASPMVDSPPLHAPLTRSTDRARYLPPVQRAAEMRHSPIDRRLRRKTLGGDNAEHQAALNEARNLTKTASPPAGNNSLHRRPHEINWSVNELCSIFDKISSRPSCGGAALRTNYAVVKPPPLTVEATHGRLRLAPNKVNMVHSIRANFERRATNESYV